MRRSILAGFMAFVAALLLGSFGPDARAAATAAYAPIDAGIQPQFNPDSDPAVYTMGFRFSIAEPIYVTALGYNANAQFEGTHSVGIFPDTPGSPLVSADVVVPASSNAGATFYEYTTLGTPLLLPSGTYRIAGSTNDINGQSNAHGYPWSNPLSATVAPEITWLEGSFGNGGPLTWPNFQTSNAFYTANFLFTPVPEPGTLAVLSIAAVALVGRRSLRR